MLVWKATKKVIILLGDLNKNVHAARFTKRHHIYDLRLWEQCLETNRVRLPGTFVIGTLPIYGWFATSGVNCMYASILPQYITIGDHRASY